MSSKTNQLSEAMSTWIHNHSLRTSSASLSLFQETASHEDGLMITSPEQLQFLAFLATSLNAQKTIEVGVFTGASALAVAEVLPDHGTVVACDLTDEYMPIATKAWDKAGVNSKVDMRFGPAIDTLQELIDAGETGEFDMMYIDADKVNSHNYYELGLQLIRVGGIIAIDNMFYGGQVADSAFDDDENTVATRSLTDALHHDERVDFTLIPIGDGLALMRKR
ncbi:MAG: class I SAM-dependent methyltransferase [Planctomycetota bacterium]|nr:class I SAM-dependent methyltransferase [Planctomycetota bacterium]